jgi:hypothetical protein
LGKLIGEFGELFFASPNEFILLLQAKFTLLASFNNKGISVRISIDIDNEENFMVALTLKK